MNVLRATAELQEAMRHDPKIGTFVTLTGSFIAVGLLYADSTGGRPKVFDTFLGLESLLQSAVPTTHGTMKSLVYSLDLLDTVFR